MNEPWSIKTPLAKRTVCHKCDHFHSAAKRKKCACCAVDVANYEAEGGIVL